MLVKVDSSKLLVLHDLDGIDGLSTEDMAAIARSECCAQAPLDAQQVAEEQADALGRGVGGRGGILRGVVGAAADERPLSPPPSLWQSSPTACHLFPPPLG